LLAGAIVTRDDFLLPGIGRLSIQAISNRDYYLVQGCILANSRPGENRLGHDRAGQQRTELEDLAP